MSMHFTALPKLPEQKKCPPKCTQESPKLLEKDPRAVKVEVNGGKTAPYEPPSHLSLSLTEMCPHVLTASRHTHYTMQIVTPSHYPVL